MTDMGKRNRKSDKNTADVNSNGATIGYESELWEAANLLRGSMDASEYKHVVLGLIFLKYISDAFEEMYAQLQKEVSAGADPEDKDEYIANNVFWVPAKSRWGLLKENARKAGIGKVIDNAMTGIEEENSSLKGVLPKGYARPTLDKQRLGELVDLVNNIKVGDEAARSRDVLGRVYEYFLSRFASAEGRRGGEFYTPRCIVKLLVEMLEPFRGRVYDPCCGSAGMFVQSIEFIRAHQTGNGNGRKLPKGTKADISIFGQESNHTTWRLAKMNLAIRGIHAKIEHGDSFHNDLHPGLKVDYILANPPFNDDKWGSERFTDTKRWKYGTPPNKNANYAWIQHFVHHLGPAGTAGFVLANGSMSTEQSGEGEIRKNIIEANLVDCMVALPGQLFYSVQIPACLWFLSRQRGRAKLRRRHDEILFIDASRLGRMIDRTHRELTDEDIERIANTYHLWRSADGDEYTDILGFCKSAKLDEVRKFNYVLTPGRFVGAKPQADDGEPFEDKMKRLTKQLAKQVETGRRLDKLIQENMESLGFGNGQ